MTGQFHRLSELNRPTLRFTINGEPAEGLTGDTLLAAILNCGLELRHSEFSETRRAGFCLMGACQDCWVQLEDGPAARACTTPLEEGMRVVTRPQGEEWLTPGS